MMPIYRMLYLDRQAPLLLYDRDHLHATLHSSEGARQGCVLGMVIFCLAIAPHLRRIASLGGLPFEYADDCNILCTPEQASRILRTLPPELAQSGLTLNSAKTKYLPPTDTTIRPDLFEDIYATYETDNDDRPPHDLHLAQVVQDLKILGGPYGAAPFAGPVLAERAAAHGRLTDFAAEVADNGQRHAAIRLLQTAACRRH